MSNQVQQKPPTWSQIIDIAAPKFNEIASRNKLVTWAEESQFAIQAIQKNDKLAQCLPHTVQNAIVNVAAVGLTLNPALGYAYLVPEGVKQNGGGFKQECMLRVSFKGLMKIATDSGSIKWCKAEVVKANDTFTYCGPCDMPKHEMNPFGDRGATVGAYCVAKTHDGDYLVDIMGADEIQKIRNAAKTKYVWDAWPDEMTKKAIIKRASKQWPHTDQAERLDQAIAVVNEYEGSENIRDITPYKPKPDQIEKPKETLTDERLELAIERIQAGSLTRERIEQGYELTPEQKARFDEALKPKMEGQQ